MRWQHYLEIYGYNRSEDPFSFYVTRSRVKVIVTKDTRSRVKVIKLPKIR